MTKEKIDAVMKAFSNEAKRIYSDTLINIILYGSCARGDYEEGSDLDIMLLLDVPREMISLEKKKIRSFSNRLSLDHDVVIAPVFENNMFYNKYMDASGFFQNINKEGISYV